MVPASYRVTRLLLVLWAVLIVPLSFWLPIETSFENGLFENLQVAALLGGAVLCVGFASRTPSGLAMWRAAAGVFLILALRELSWGRVFLVKGYTELGEPILPASSEMPFHDLIHGAVGLAAVVCLYFIVRRTPWKRVVKAVPFPALHVVLLIVGAVLSAWGDHHTIFYSLQDQVIEEMAELLTYLVLCHLAWHYSLYLRKE